MTKIDGIELSEDEIDLAYELGLEDFLDDDDMDSEDVIATYKDIKRRQDGKL